MGSRHRTRSGRRVVFQAEPGSPVPLWLRTTLARNLRSLEERIGVRLRRVGGSGSPPALVPPLGCGAHGCVFELEDGRALKVSADESEGPLTLYVMGLQARGFCTGEGPVLAATARIDDVFAFPRRVRVDGSLTPVFGIVRERVGPAGSGASVDVEEAADLYAEGWDAYCEAELPGARYVGVAVARVGLRRLWCAGAAGRQLAALLEYAWADGLPLMDVHSSNVARRLRGGDGGAREGQLVVFDLGRTESCTWPREGDLPMREQAQIPYEDRLEELGRQIPVLPSR